MIVVTDYIYFELNGCCDISKHREKELLGFMPVRQEFVSLIKKTFDMNARLI